MIAKKPKYSTFDRYEIDFFIGLKNEIIPIEVKSSENDNNTSFNKYNEIYNPKLRIRFSTNNLSYDGNVLNIPLFIVEFFKQLINLL